MVYCTYCRRPGHWRSQCYSLNRPSSSESSSEGMEVCERCGRDSHIVKNCYATYHMDGHKIEHAGVPFGSSPSHRQSTVEISQEPRHQQVYVIADDDVSPGSSQSQRQSTVERRELSQQGVYVLKLDDGCIYVGLSKYSISARIEMHRQGYGGAAWCKIHGCLNLERLDPISPRSEDLDNWERNETHDQMYKHGISKVRGWAYTQETLPYDDLKGIKREITERNKLCRQCGRKGHFISACTHANDKAAWLQKLEALMSEQQRGTNSTGQSSARISGTSGSRGGSASSSLSSNCSRNESVNILRKRMLKRGHSTPNVSSRYAASPSSSDGATQKPILKRHRSMPTARTRDSPASSNHSTHEKMSQTIVEPAKSNRSKCYVCGWKIDKGVNRHGTLTPEQYYKWRHIKCSRLY